jgi:hypothetical protein
MMPTKRNANIQTSAMTPDATISLSMILFVVSDSLEDDVYVCIM